MYLFNLFILKMNSFLLILISKPNLLLKQVIILKITYLKNNLVFV